MSMKEDFSGGMHSPGGFAFGVQGWSWGEPRPKSITFFLDGTAKVSDQHGRPIPGTEIENKRVLFAKAPPAEEEPAGSRSKLANHQQVIAALDAERIDWKTLVWSGWPQLPYAELKKLPNLIPTAAMLSRDTFDSFIADIRKIKDSNLRKDALRVVREAYEMYVREATILDEE